MNCFNLKTNKIKTVLSREAVSFLKKLSQFSLLSVNPYFIIDVFSTYRRGEDFTNQYLEMNFCKNLGQSLSERFNIEVDVFV